jgi:hypothetical protein
MEGIGLGWQNPRKVKPLQTKNQFWRLILNYYNLIRKTINYLNNILGSNLKI